MKKIAVRGLIALAAVILIVLVIASTKPDTFRVERSISINAPAEKIAPFINDLHSWREWSPFEKLDPAMKRTLSGPTSGVGAVYEWEGNSNAGSGRMEIMDTLHSKITIKLDFLKPFEGHNIAEFTMVPEGNSTKVTWAMYGPNQFIGKVMTIFFSMDKMLGREFESGLVTLKAIAEK